MFKLFRSRKERVGLIYPVYQKVNQAINRRARKLSDRLNKKVNKVGKRWIGLLLIIFSFGWCAASVYVALESFQHKEAPLKVKAVRVPRYIYGPRDNSMDSLTARVLRRIGAFKNYMDSLREHDQEAYKIILRQRPGLMDSIAMIEQAYGTFKNK